MATATANEPAIATAGRHSGTPPVGDSTPVVAIDVGGTHARFALAQIAADGAIALGESVTLATCDHAGFQAAWSAFARQTGGGLPRAAAIAVAGPVDGAVIRFTNNSWMIDPARLADQLAVDRFTLVNDFGAVGHAVLHAGADDFLHLTGPDAPLPTRRHDQRDRPRYRARRGACLAQRGAAR